MNSTLDITKARSAKLPVNNLPMHNIFQRVASILLDKEKAEKNNEEKKLLGSVKVDRQYRQRLRMRNLFLRRQLDNRLDTILGCGGQVAHPILH